MSLNHLWCIKRFTLSVSAACTNQISTSNSRKRFRRCCRYTKGSPTFGQHVAVELTAENKKQLLVPRGFAHGFVVLSKEATFAYKVDNYYSPECDRGIAFNDED